MNFPEDSHNAKQSHGFRRFPGSLVVLNTELMAAYTNFQGAHSEDGLPMNRLLLGIVKGHWFSYQ